MSWKDPFVRAGIATPAYFSAKEGRYPEAFFRYRKPSPTEVEKQHAEAKQTSGNAEALIESMQKFVTLYISEWSFSAPCNAEYVKLLNHPLLLKVYFLILQADATEPIPAKYLQEGEVGTPEGELKKS